jgi:hypothetical protein
LRHVPGCEVLDTGDVGHGFTDLVVAYRKLLRFMEVKDGAKPPSARKLTPDEEKWRALLGELYCVVTSVEEAKREIGAP